MTDFSTNYKWGLRTNQDIKKPADYKPGNKSKLRTNKSKSQQHIKTTKLDKTEYKSKPWEHQIDQKPHQAKPWEHKLRQHRTINENPGSTKSRQLKKLTRLEYESKLRTRLDTKLQTRLIQIKTPGAQIRTRLQKTTYKSRTLGAKSRPDQSKKPNLQRRRIQIKTKYKSKFRNTSRRWTKSGQIKTPEYKPRDYKSRD